MKNYLLMMALLFSLNCWAQTAVETPWMEKGQLQIGVGAAAGVNNATGGFLRATPYGQYFLKDDWSIRLEGRFDFSGDRGDGYMGAGLVNRYHVVKTKRFSLYGQAGYFYGHEKASSFKLVETAPTMMKMERTRLEYNYGYFNVGVGAQYRFGSRWTLNAQVEKNVARPTFGSDNFTLGISFRIK